MSLLVVGSVAFDAIETPFGRTERTIGGAATYFALAAGLLSPVRLVGVVGEDFAAKDAAVFHGRKVDLACLERAPGKSFFWAGRYSSDLRTRETLQTDLNVFASFQPKLPEAYRDSSFVFLGNIDPQLQRNVLKQMRRRPKLVALDTMNYWISGTRAELEKTLKLIDALLINDEEACQLAGESNLLRAARIAHGAESSRHQAWGIRLDDVSSRFDCRRSGLSARRSSRPHGRRRQLRGRLHGLSCEPHTGQSRFAASRDGVRLGARKLRGGEAGRRAPANGQTPRSRIARA